MRASICLLLLIYSMGCWSVADSRTISDPHAKPDDFSGPYPLTRSYPLPIQPDLNLKIGGKLDTPSAGSILGSDVSVPMGGIIPPLPDVSTLSKMMPGASDLSKMIPDTPDLSKIMPIDSTMSSMIPDVPDLSKMMPSYPTLSSMTPDASDLSTILPSDSLLSMPRPDDFSLTSIIPDNPLASIIPSSSFGSSFLGGSPFGKLFDFNVKSTGPFGPLLDFFSLMLKSILRFFGIG